VFIRGSFPFFSCSSLFAFFRRNVFLFLFDPGARKILFGPILGSASVVSSGAQLFSFLTKQRCGHFFFEEGSDLASFLQFCALYTVFEPSREIPPPFYLKRFLSSLLRATGFDKDFAHLCYEVLYSLAVVLGSSFPRRLGRSLSVLGSVVFF